MSEHSTTIIIDSPDMPDHTLLRCIGQGAFGEVWLARSNATGRYRAVKIVRRQRFKDGHPYELEFSGLRRFEEVSREHLGFVDILHIKRDPGDKYFCYVMELADDMDGATNLHPDRYEPKTLANEMIRRGPLPYADCVRVGLALSAALEELHRRGLVHRDVKPSNIIYVRGAPKLADVSLVAEVDADFRSMAGSPGYLDERLHGTPGGDLYSLGKVLYGIATGRTAEDWPALPEPPDSADDAEEFRELSAVFLKACHDDRARRFQSAGEIHAQLLLLQAGRSARRLQRFDRIAAGIRRYGLFVLGLVVLAAVVTYQWSERKRQDADLRQRQVGSYVAYGSQAMENNDLLGALPWFAEAYRLDRNNPRSADTHRLRMGSVLHFAPTIVQMWLTDNLMRQASFAGAENKVLRSFSPGRWGICDVASGQPLHPLFGTGNERESVSIALDSEFAVTCPYGDNRVVTLWNYVTGRRQAQFTAEPDLYPASISRDGKWVAAVSDGRNIVLWLTSIADEPHRILASDHDEIRSLRFSPDGRMILSCGGDGRVAVWSVPDGRLIQEFNRHTSTVYDADFSPDSTAVASASHDRTVRVWAVDSGLERLPALRHRDAVFSVRFSGDGLRLAAAGLDFAAHVWDAQTGEFLQRIRHNSKVVQASFSPRGRYLITTSYDGTVRVWDLRGGTRSPAPSPVSFAADGSRFLAVADQGVDWFEAGAERPLWSLVFTNGSLRRHVLDDDGHRLLAVLADLKGELRAEVYDCRVRTRLWPPRELPRDLSGLAMCPGGTNLIAWSESALETWHLPNGRAGLALKQPISEAVPDPTGKLVAIASERGLQLWPVRGGDPLWPSPGSHTAAVRSIVWSHDGRRLVTAASDNRFDPEDASVWEAATGEIISRLPHRDGVNFATFSPDDGIVATCGEDFSAILWDPETGTQLTPPLQHRHQVKHAAFSSDGRWLATACEDATARIWDVAAGEPLTPAIHHPDPVEFVQFARSNRVLVTRTSAGETRVWTLPLETRPVNDLIQIAEFLSSEHSHSGEAMIPQTRSALQALWEDLRRRYANDFSVNQE